MHNEVKLSLIVARGRNNVIGASGRLPWRLKSDLLFFKKVTLGNPIIMGRKTWESLPKRPLPERENIVMTRDWTYDAPGARVYSSFSAAMNAAKAIAVREGKREVFVIGGEAIYNSALPLTDRIYLTDVDAQPDGDAFFPTLVEDEWHERSADHFDISEGNDHAFTIRVLERMLVDSPA